MKNKLKIGLISLGCPKNLVDSEVMLGMLGRHGYIISGDPDESDIIIINTCSFIEPAREESYRVIEEFLNKKNSQQKLIVTGCLSQLEKRRLFELYPEIDAVLGSGDFPKILDAVRQLYKGRDKYYSVSIPRFIQSHQDSRLVTTPPSYAYLKIAEGCSHTCSFCIIPKLRGRYRSRPIEDVLKEARQIANLGFKEIILVGQDTTAYGVDRYGKSKLAQLLERLEEIGGIEWIRFLYGYPTGISKELIRVMKDSKKICRYIDLPLQHTDEGILKRMRRPSFKYTRRIIDNLRKEMGDITLRSSFIIGFPDETEKRFKRLLSDIKSLSLDWAGFFPFSPERGLGSEIPLTAVMERYKELSKVQREITQKKNRMCLGRRFPILIDTSKEAHTEFQAPEIDGRIVLKKRQKPGTIIQKRMEKTRGWYDLVC